MSLLRPLDDFELTGRRRSHVVEGAEPPCVLHRAALDAFLAMRDAARDAGLDLRAASSFRDFDRQLAIWNAKFLGARALHDRDGRLLAAGSLPPPARIEAILFWSALPGASRHHWGSDLDVFDGAALADPSMLQLVPQEYAAGGPFARLTAWLDDNMQRFGFYRPYATAGAGVSPEPWHLSFAPLAAECLQRLSPQLLQSALATAPLEGREVVLSRLPALHQRFVAGVDPPPPQSLAFELRDHRSVV